MTSPGMTRTAPAATRSRGTALVAVFALLAALPAAPAPADWLVLADGSTIQTAGPWRVEGRLVVFELTGGRLASLRLDEVRLAASEEATAAARAPRKPAEPLPTRRKARVVITDADIPKARPAAAEAKDGAGSGATKASRASELVVLSWEAVELPFGGVQIYGSVQNQGPEALTGAGLRVLLYDSEGLLLTSAEARLAGSVLPSQARSNFSVGFDALYGGLNGGVFAFAGVRFDPYYRGFEPWSDDI